MLRPDSYIGSIESNEQEMWILPKGEDKLKLKTISYVPGLYKIFGKKGITSWFCILDEILVNAADNIQRDKKCNIIKVEIDQKASRISVWNNGKGIPI